ncbi:MAG: hypothetical protein KAS62_10875, partial [Candidatus Delongbacteria bacterium]|nr:hypothetical protein [Candidatus Delongbacteria bacterium]
MKNARIVLAIIILVLINCIQAQSNHKAAISFDCDKYLGFYFQSDTQETVGHVTHMKISDDTELQNDLVVKDPLNYPQSVSVVGVLDDIYWEGSYADPIQMNFLVSTTNKNYVTILVHSALSNTNVFFDFNVYS